MQARLSPTVVLEGTIYICNKKSYFTILLKIPSGYTLCQQYIIYNVLIKEY